jgi:4-hydroxy-3-methylbut-2-enyl diphosphate reductase
MKREITVASLAGFCFGVKRAVDTALSLSEKTSLGERVYALGKPVHNSDVCNDLEKRGVKIIDSSELCEIMESASKSSPVTLITRAHGTDKALFDSLVSFSEKNSFFKTVDCTCPFVKRIHTIATEKTNENSLLCIFGDENHPEVKAIRSYAKGDSVAFDSTDEAKKLITDKKSLILVSQTTQKLSEWEKIQLFFKKYCTNVDFFDTICSVTENRQNEAVCLADKVQLMVVVGGKDSSNTKSLYFVSKKVLDNTVWVENAEELKSLGLSLPDKIGITAGASTPAHIIEEVYKTMSEVKENATFEEMLEESLKTLNTGDIVTGVITSITSTEVHVDLSAKVTGILAVDELVPDASQNINDLYKVGDTIEAFVVRVSDVEGVAGLSRKRIERMSEWKKIVEAHKEGTVLEGKVTEAVKGGVIISSGYSKVFVPASQTGVAKDADLSTLIGSTQKFVIIDINEQRNRAVASIKTVLRAEHKAATEQFWNEIEEGKKFTGTVKSLTSYGAFVDLGAVDGMVHISELSWSRIKNPAEVVSVGDTIEVFVKSFDAEKKRISLGCKTDDNNPWNIFMNNYKVDDVATVKIVGLTPFGAFAEISPDVDGLIHISQIADKKIGNPAEYLEVGQEVDAKIVAIDEDKKKVSLSIRALLAPAAEETAEEAADEE